MIGGLVVADSLVGLVRIEIVREVVGILRHRQAKIRVIGEEDRRDRGQGDVLDQVDGLISGQRRHLDVADPDGCRALRSSVPGASATMSASLGRWSGALVGDLGRDRDRAAPGRVGRCHGEGRAHQIRGSRCLDQDGRRVVRRTDVFVIVVIALGNRTWSG